MAFSPRTVRIVAASALSVVFIAGAYAFSGPLTFLNGKIAGAQSTDDLLKAYAAKDSDGDALPDWQEALYGTDPNNPHSVNASLTDSEAVNKGMVTPKTSAAVPGDQATDTPDTAADVPGTDPAAGSLTDEFGKQFFQEYVAASKGGTLTDDQKDALISKLLADYSLKASKLLVSPYNSLSIRVSNTATVTEYADAVENIFRAHDVPADSSRPAELMQKFLQDNDTSAQKRLVVSSAAYSAIAADLLLVPVPQSLAAQHLALVQSFDTLARSTKAVTNYENDPLAVLGSLSLYEPTAKSMVRSLQEIAQAIIAYEGEPAPGTPGAIIVSLARSAEQQ